MPSLAQELRASSTFLHTDRINDALRNHNVEEIAQFIRSSENIECVILRCSPVNEELGRRVSDAIVQNANIRKLNFDNSSVAIQDLVAWIGSRNTLVNMTSLEAVRVWGVYAHGMSVSDCSALFPLLLTSRSLHFLRICFRGGAFSDDVMGALSAYVGAASLREFRFLLPRILLSEATFTALCDNVALSTVQKFVLSTRFVEEFS